MNKLNKYFALILVVLASIVANNCTDDFDSLNSDPRTIALINPEQLFYRAQTEFLQSGHCWSSIYIAKIQWMQYGTPHMYYTGVTDMNTRWTYHRTDIGNTLYNEYNNMGSYVTTIGYLAGKSSSPDMYSDLIQMGRILLIAKAIQTSDMWGSLAYSNAWLSRKGMVDEESMSPRFETQEELVAIWDAELKECIQKLQALQSATDKVALRGIDRAYAGDPQKWIKAANAIRLRLASRIWKVQPATAKAIAAEVLAPANAANVLGSIDDSFILRYDNLYTNNHGGDWHSVDDLNRASATFMDYLNKYEDPRRPIYFRINNLTKENIEEFNRQQIEGNTQTSLAPRQNPFRMIPPDFGQWMGAVMSLDRRAALPVPPTEPKTGDPALVDPLLPPQPNRANFPDGDAGTASYNTAYSTWYDDMIANHWDFDLWKDPKITYDRRWTRITFRLPNATADIDMLPANRPQVRLWMGNRESGSGQNWAPVMTFADFCYLAAEFVLRESIPSSKTAQQWYETGLKGSLDQWNSIGDFCKLHDYVAMTEAQIDNFLNKEDIKWDAAKGLEQIYVQTWVEHYKNVDEMWAFWKRTNYPNTTVTNIVAFEPVMVSQQERVIPRRAKFTLPGEGTHNYDNLMKRIEDMKKDPKFGEIGNEWGRLWWDVE